MADGHNVFDEMLDFETKMYHFLDPPRSPEIVPSPEERRRESLDASYAMYTAPSASNYFQDPSGYSSSMNNGGGGDSPKSSSKWFCTQCNRSFAAQFALDQHRRFKHQGYKIHCRYCPHTSTNGYALFLHVQREHSEVDGNSYALNGLKSNTKKAINARRKRRAVKSRQSTLSESDAVVIGGVSPRNLLASPSYRTPPTSSYAADVSSIGVGGGEQRSAAAATVNGTVTSSKSTGRRKRAAMKIVRQAGIPTLDCDKCGKKFAFHSGLRMHTKMVHSGFRFTCQYCGLHFTNGYAIHRHVNIVHNIIGAVRNSGFSAATPERDVGGDDAIDVKPTMIAVGEASAAETNDSASTNHIRLRLRRKALPSKAVSTNLEWSMDTDNNSQPPESMDQIMRRFSAPAAGADTSACTSASVAEATCSATTFIRCLLCPFKAEDLETLKLHSFKHNSSSSSSTSAGSTSTSSDVVLRRCPYCNYTVDQLSAYVVHASTHFWKPSPLARTSRRPTGPSVKLLETTNATTLLSLRCTYCDRSFHTNNELSDHEKKHVAKLF